MRAILTLALAEFAAAISAALYWMAVDAVSISRAVASPFPYVLLGLIWFVAIPVGAALNRRKRVSLLAALAISTAVASPAAMFMFIVALSPFDGALLIFTTSWVAAITFWLMLWILPNNLAA